MKRKPSITSNNSLEDFIKGAKDEKTHIKQKPKEEEIDLNALRRQTYYISELHIKAINQMAFYENMDKSEIVRAALEQYIPKKYIQMSLIK